MKKTILITGINGFLGSNLALLFKDSYNIVGLEISTQNLWRLQGEAFPVYTANAAGLDELFAKHTLNGIIHAATLYGRNNETQQQLFEANTLNPLALLNKAIENKVDFFINTDTVLDRYTSTYALTKKQFTDWLMHRQNDIKVVNMPLEHFYGPNCPDTNFITTMVKKLKANEPRIDLTKGEPQRNFVYFSDLLDAYKLVLNKLDLLVGNFNEFEVSTPELISIKELMSTLKELTNSKTELNFGALPYRPNELMKSIVNNKELVALGWQPKVSIKEGLKLTVEKIL
jgi:nucleoside-diphosphate-sugar epimerase